MDEIKKPQNEQQTEHADNTPKKKSHIRRWITRSILTIVLTPIILIVLLAVALYIPPIQNWAVHLASDYASEATGMEIKVREVHLAFPIDFSIEGVSCIKQNDSLPNVKDTIAMIDRAVVDVELLPLFDKEVKVNTMELLGMQMNTSDFVHEARVKGRISRMAIEKDSYPESHVVDVNLDNEGVNLAHIILDEANLNVELSDTVPPDTTESKSKWLINVKDLKVHKSSFVVHMPGDTLQVALAMKEAVAANGMFDIGKGIYQLATFTMEDGNASFDNNFITPLRKGIDSNHLKITNLFVNIDSLRSQGADLRVNIRDMKLKERSGLELKSFSAKVLMDSLQVKFNGGLSTPWSNIFASLTMDLNAFDTWNPGTINALIDGSFGRNDLLLFATDGSANTILPRQPITLKGHAIGNLDKLSIPNFHINVPTIMKADISGETRGFMALAADAFSRKFRLKLNTDITTYNMQFIKSMMDKSTASTINIPAMHAAGTITANGPEYTVNMKAKEGSGNASIDADLNLATEHYYADIKANNFNLSHFVMGKGLGIFTGTLRASGKGFDVMSQRTHIEADADIKRCDYGRYDLNNITASINMNSGKAAIDAEAHNTLIDGTLSLNTSLDTKWLEAELSTNLNKIDFFNLGIVKGPLQLGMNSNITVRTDFGTNLYLDGYVRNISIADSARIYHPNDITANVLARVDTTMLKMYCGDFAANMHAQGSFRNLQNCGQQLMAAINRQIANKEINQVEIRECLPNMTLTMKSGTENPIYRFIKANGMEFNMLDVDMASSKIDGLNGNLTIHGLNMDGTRLDTLQAWIISTNDPYEITYKAHIQNGVKTSANPFNAYAHGKILEHGISTNIDLYDNVGKMSNSLGAIATLEENGIRIQLTPTSPTLTYRTVHLNPDNYIILTNSGRIYADVVLTSDDGSGLKVYTGEESGEETDYMQDITVTLHKLNLAQFLSSIPYAPNVEGLLNGDLHFLQEKDKSFSLSTDLTINNMVYEGCNIGDLGMDLVYMPKENGDNHYIDGRILLNEEEVGNLEGSYNFNTGSIVADMTFEKFPMQITNGFIPDQLIGLEGTADGTLTIRGTTQHPMVNGELFLESASLFSVPYGVKLTFDDDPIRIDNSKLLLENFQMYATNKEPLLIHGAIDFANTDHITTDLRIKATNFLLIDAKESSRSEAYGKAYINFFGRMTGELDKLDVRGRMDILPATNLFYILRDSPLTTDNRLNELVKFVDLQSGEQMTVTRPTIDGLAMNLTLNVQNGSHIKCWLNDNHSNYLDIIGEGNLKMKMEHDQLNMTGNYTITEGEMKYSLPIIPLKTFKITEGSNLEFTGDVTNPRLDIIALETVKSSVNINGSNQMITFNTGVKLSKTLSDMGLEFLIESPENQEVADELSMKSSEERGKLAVTLLTTGMYLTDGNTSAFSMNSALNTFLQSEINNIAGKALQTLDFSFGMDNSTEEDGTIHTNYNFKFAKRFWNNRLSISVGGKISSGPDVAGQNKSFFDNVEAQYRLSDNSNQYLQLFYNRSVYDYLEGYVGQYGAGYMWKKKMQSLKYIFKEEPRMTFSRDSTQRNGFRTGSITPIGGSTYSKPLNGNSNTTATTSQNDSIKK